MTTEDFINDLFCRVDDQMPDAQKHSQASLYPSEVVTIAILFALKGVGNRAFYRWLERDCRQLFPRLPVRTRLFRLFNTHRQWPRRFMADPSLIGRMRIGKNTGGSDHLDQRGRSTMSRHFV